METIEPKVKGDPKTTVRLRYLKDRRSFKEPGDYHGHHLTLDIKMTSCTKEGLGKTIVVVGRKNTPYISTRNPSPLGRVSGVLTGDMDPDRSYRVRVEETHCQ